MVHFPSFIVGGMFSGATFLLLHEQVSHRSKLSDKWWIRETAEQKWKEIKTGAQSTANVRSTAPSYEKEWNKAIGRIQDALNQKDP